MSQKKNPNASLVSISKAREFQANLPKANKSKISASETMIIERSLRSGQSEKFDGNVVLIGQLNEGAEILAGGSVLILGRLKGCVHAGRKNVKNAYIVAGSFESHQVRLGDRLCSQLGADVNWWKKPVIITLEDEEFLFRKWNLSEG
jgi:septum site-determining protein MinC